MLINPVAQKHSTKDGQLNTVLGDYRRKINEMTGLSLKETFVQASEPRNVEAGTLWLDLGDGWDDLGFLDLADTPGSYVGQGSKFIKVNATPDGLEFVAEDTIDHDALTNTHDNPYKLDDLAVPDDNEDLNVSIAKHGLTPKAPDDITKFLRGDVSWAVPPTGEGGGTPVGVILAWLGGYFTGGANQGYTRVLGTANTVAAVNTLLNNDGWYVCDGALLNLLGSPIFDGASRYLPNLTDDRFIMGDTLGGTPGGDNAMAHTHVVGTLVIENESSHTHGFGNLGTDTEGNHGHGDSFSVSSHTLSINEMPQHQHVMFSSTTGNDYLDGTDYPYFRRNEATDDDYMIRGHTSPVPVRGINKLKGGSAGHSHGLGGGVSAGGSHSHSVNSGATGAGSEHSHGISGSTGVASVTENRPKFLGCFYIMRAI